MIMTLQERLERKVHDYCIKRDRALVENSIGYLGINPSARLPSGEFKPMHVVGFDVWAIENVTTQRNFVCIDPQTEELVLLITPHSQVRLED